MIAALEWIGARARWVLAVGAFAALLLQDLAATLRPLLPLFVALIYALAMVRVDLLAVARRAISPRRLGRTVMVSIALIGLTPVILWALGHGIGLDAPMVEAMVYGNAAPPIASAAAICLLLGLDAAFALEVSIVASFLTPLIGPAVTVLLLGDAVPLDGTALALRLAAMIAAGAAIAMIGRYLIGPETIDRRKLVFDGLGAAGMLVFIIPIFDGVTAQIIGAPLLALAVLALAAIPNFAMQIAITLAGHRIASHETAGSAGLMWGNRNVSLYLAALPESPLFTLYVALYQFPMYVTPLVMRRFFTRRH